MRQVTERAEALGGNFAGFAAAFAVGSRAITKRGRAVTTACMRLKLVAASVLVGAAAVAALVTERRTRPSLVDDYEE
jgi:hypothetical protein